ncbi:MAG: DUF3516 domain-containing protein [Myxococcota bacterium]
MAEIEEDKPPIRPLGERIPEEGLTDPDEALDVFIGWVTDLGLSLYPAQEEAVLELFSGASVILKTPTGSGKSMVALAMHFWALARARKSIYTAPIKALVSEKFFSLCRTFGAEEVGMMTGDGSINRGAPIICCTAEVLAQMALQEGEHTPYQAVIMDEFHYYGDRDRGRAWQIPLLTMPQSRFLLMSATLGDTSEIETDLAGRTGERVAVVQSSTRPVPLDFEYRQTPLHETLESLLRSNKAPVYVVHFSQKAATDTAGALMSINFSTREEKAAIKEALKGFRFDSPYGPDIRRFVQHGVGLHHAGLLPKYRLLVERLAQQGLLKVICGTDTLGVGINVPIRTVLFTRLCKFDGESVDILSVRDFKQIAGRAGRKGFDDRGLVVAQAPDWIIENKRMEDAVKSGKRNKKKFVKKKPPKRGYKHWDEETYRQLIAKPPETLESQFHIDHNLLLSLLRKAEETEDDTDGLDELRALIGAAHTTKGKTARLLEKAEEMLNELVEAGIVEQFGDRSAGGDVFVSGNLQADFSMHHTLSLFLFHALSLLDAESETYALDVVTLVEAVLENPRPVLLAQANELKGKMIAAMKAEGIPYEERMEKIEDVSWPKPRAEWIYETFNEYADAHPWASGELIRPKSIVRDMVERYASFADYIHELRLPRVEGVLLRYLTQAYKALLQSVPQDRMSDALLDIQAFVRAMLARVDSSLVTEWERMAAGDATPEDEPPRPVDISENKKAFRARVRAEMHALLRALSREDWDDAASSVRDPTDPIRAPWSGEDFEKALSPFIAEHGPVRFDGRARQAWNTILQQTDRHQWTIRQVLTVDQPEIAGAYDDEVEEVVSAWAIDGVIDLRSDTNPEGPIIEIVQISE